MIRRGFMKKIEKGVYHPVMGFSKPTTPPPDNKVTMQEWLDENR